MENHDKWTIASFKYWAKEDNEEAYTKYKRKKQIDIITNTLESQNGTHNDIAKALFEGCEEEFICSSLASKLWYQFLDHRWKEIEEGIYLRLKISNELWHLYDLEYNTWKKKVG